MNSSLTDTLISEIQFILFDFKWSCFSTKENLCKILVKLNQNTFFIEKRKL